MSHRPLKSFAPEYIDVRDQNQVDDILTLRQVAASSAAIPEQSSTLTPCISHPTPPKCTPSIFFAILTKLVLHPELNSKNILRAEVVADSSHPGDEPEASPLDGYRCIRLVRRRLVPKSPRDTDMLQDCYFLAKDEEPNSHGHRDAVVLFVPILDRSLEPSQQYESIPFYHPKVRALAWRYLCPPPPLHRPSHPDDETPETGKFQIDFLPFHSLPSSSSESQDDPIETRTQRTMYQLLQVLYRHSLSYETPPEPSTAGDAPTTPVSTYIPRRSPPLLVPLKVLQDTYLQMKPRYSWLINAWQEKTDPMKHVWEDASIACWLIVLWGGMYGWEDDPTRPGAKKAKGPPGGFVDLGCGNGLLVYILTNEGYAGFGLDLRERKSWKGLYSAGGSSDVEHEGDGLSEKVPLRPPSKVPDLRATSLDVVSIVQNALSDSDSATASDGEEWPFPDDCFIIGNHPDELTPWIPLLSALTPSSLSFPNGSAEPTSDGAMGVPFLNIPCCFHAFEGGHFNFNTMKIRKTELDALADELGMGCTDSNVPPSESSGSKSDTASPSHPLLKPYFASEPRYHHHSATTSSTPLLASASNRYFSYQLYIAHLTLQLGYVPEREALRIPSTKDWAILGRKRVWEVGASGDGAKGREAMLGKVKELVERATEWAPRTPEGRKNDH